MVMRVSLRIEWFALAGHSHSVVPQARHYSKSASFHREVYFTLKMGIIELLEQLSKCLGVICDGQASHQGVGWGRDAGIDTVAGFNLHATSLLKIFQIEYEL